MAVDGYMYFLDYDSKYLGSESQVDDQYAEKGLWTTFEFNTAKSWTKENAKSGLFEIEDFSFDIEQTLNIGSQSTGAGAGKVTFNPFSITRKIDRASPTLFERACSGTPYKQVALGLRKSSGGKTAGQVYCVFLFKLVAVKTISWSYDDESPKETTTFEYGGLQVHYAPQNADGTMGSVIPGGWNRVKNVSDQKALPEIK